MSADTAHNGRSKRVLAWLQTQPKPRTPAQIIAGCDPGTTMIRMCSTLAAMARGGFLERIGAGKGKVSFRAAAVQPARKPGPAPTGWQSRRALKREAAAASTSSPAPRSQQRSPQQNPARMMRKSAPLRPVQPANFVAPLNTVFDPNSHKRLEGQRLAKDIASFRRNGGRIERLPDGASADPLKHNHHR